MSYEYWLTTCVIMVPGILWRRGSIPGAPGANWLNAPSPRPALLHRAGITGRRVWLGAVGLLIGFAVLIIPWLMHAWGRDVKLMMAIGVWLDGTDPVVFSHRGSGRGFIAW